jgi:hypothetical protein
MEFVCLASAQFGARKFKFCDKSSSGPGENQ